MPESTPRRGFSRRSVIRSLAASSVAAPIALGASERADAAPGAGPVMPGLTAQSGTLEWYPSPATDGMNAFEGLEADRTGLYPTRHYAYVEDADHYRLNIWADDLDSTGSNDRQRTEVKGMVRNGTALQMLNGQTWQINYAMYIPSSLHGTKNFTHIFQTKTVSPDAGPWCTLDLTRAADGTEMINARAYGNSGSPDIAAATLAPLRDRWVTVQWTLTVGQSGAATFTLLNGTGASAPVFMTGRMTGVVMPAGTSYVRPKWGIYRSILSDASDIIATSIMFRNYQASLL